jgi:hypothetical protein
MQPQMAPYMSPGTVDGSTGIRITAKFMPLAFILHLFKPRMGVDGSDFPAAWNTPVFVPTPPGQHMVVTYFPYVFIKQAGKGAVGVTVNPGQIVDVLYKAPWVVFMAGKMTVR